MTTTRRRLLNRLLSRTRNPDRHGRRQRLFRPQVEPLEDRRLLAVGFLGSAYSVGGFPNGHSLPLLVPAGSDRLLTFQSAVDQNQVTGVSYDGTPMTESVGVATGTGSNARIWTLPLGSGGAINSSFVLSTSGGSALGSVSGAAFSGVNQATPIDSDSESSIAAGATSSSLIVSSEPGDMVVDAITVTSNVGFPSVSTLGGQVSLVNGGGGSGGFQTQGGASRKSGASPSQTVGWNISGNLPTESGAHVALNINQVHAAEMDVVGNGISIADGDTTPSLADHTDFGSVDIATGAVTRTFTIQNVNSAGDAPLNLTGTPRVQLSGPGAGSFTVTMLPNATVGAGSSTTFQIQFDPSTIGTKSATVSIANDDSNESPYNFAIQGTGTADSTVTQVGGLVTVTGGSIHNDLTINVSGGNLRISDAGGSLGAGTGTAQASNNMVTIPIGSVSNIVVNGNSGNDALQIDNGNTAQVTANVTFHGGAGDDALEVLGGTATEIVYTPNAGSGDTARGTIELDGQTITFTGLEPTLVTTSTTTVTIDLSSLAVSETVTLSDGGAAGQSQVTFLSNALEDLVFTNPSALLEIIGTGGAAHTINVQGLDAAFSANLTINGGGDDGVNFQTAATDIGSGALVVTGNTISLSQNVSSEGASLTAQNAISLTGTATLDAGAETVSILANQDNAGAESFSQASGTAVVTTSNLLAAVLIDVNGTGPAALAAVTAGTATGRVTIDAGGAITDSNGAATNITADAAVLSAVGSIASLPARLQLNVATVTATSTTGDIGLEEVSGNLTVVNVANGSGGSVRIDAPTGDLHVGTVSAQFNVVLQAPTGSVADTNGSGVTNVTSSTVEATSSTGIDLDIMSQVSGNGFDATGTGDILVRRPSGTLVISGGGIDAANGDISATALNGSLLTNTTISAGGAHTVTLGATGSVTMLAGATLTSGGGVDVTAGGSIDVRDLTALGNTAGGGTAAIKLDTATGNVTVSGPLTATGAAGLNIDIDPVDVNVNANMTATGDIAITASNNVTVAAGVSVTANSDGIGGGDLTITADDDASGAGNLTASTTSTLAGAYVTLSGFDVTLGTVTATADITVTAGDDVFQNANVTTGGAAAIVVTAGGGDIVMADGTTTSTGSGQITYSAPDDIWLSALTTTGDVIVTADSNNGTVGAIIDNTAAETANISGNRIALRAGTRIGEGVAPDDDDIDVAVSTLAAVTRTGDIHVQDLSGGLSIDTFDGLSGVTLTVGGAGDHITIRASSPLTVTAGDPVVNNGGGNTTLAAEGAGAGDDLTLNDDVTVTGGDGTMDGDGNIYLYAGHTVALAPAIVVVSVDAAGTVLVSAGTNYNNGAPEDGNSGGDVLMTSGAAVRSEDADITVLAPDNVQLSIVNADSDGDATAGDVIVTADYAGPGVGAGDLYASDNVGAVSDNLLSGEGPNVVGDQAALRAGTGIGDGVAGAATDIDLAVNTLAAATGSGDINVEDVDWLTIDTFNGLSGLTISNADGTATGLDDITAVTRGDLTVAASNPVLNSDGGDVTLSAQGGGHYQYFGGAIDFATALASAAAQGGYLATIRSAVENAAVQAALGGSYGWIGGSDAAVEATWQWVNGAESGIQFWSGGVGGSPVGGEYTNWSGGEPNNSGNEDGLLMWSTGSWNDATGFQAGYVLERPWANLTVNASVTITGGAGDVTLQANRDVLGNAAGDITTADGDVTITADLDNSSFGSNNDGTIQLDGMIDTGLAATSVVTLSLPDCDGYLGSGLNPVTGQGTSPNGSIVSASQVIKNDTGALRLNGTANSYVGTTAVNAGALIVNGAITTNGGPISVAGGALLGGNGTIGATAGGRDIQVSAGGTLDPGDVDPANCAIHYPGQLTVNGDITFDVDGIFRVQLNSLVAGVDGDGTYGGAGYDQLVLHEGLPGTLDLGGFDFGIGGAGAHLQADAGYAMPVGAEHTVIVYDPGDLVDQRFRDPNNSLATLDEGDFFYSGGTSNLLNISYYTKSHDNDVTLTHPGRYDFNGFHGYTATGDFYEGISPFTLKTGANSAGWQSLPPQYFERNYPVEPPYTTADEKLKYDGQSTDNMGNPLTFETTVVSGKAYNVCILTGDTLWNHDRERFQVYDANGTVPSDALTTTTLPYTQVVDTWGAGAPDGSGVGVTWGGGTANPTAGYYRWVCFTTDTIVDGPPNAGDSLGTLLMKMQDLGGYDPATVILAMDIRPVETVGQITLTRTSPAGAPPLSVLPADGLTVDTYQGTGAPPNATITVTVSSPLAPVQYATVTPDGDVSLFGSQVTANATGLFTFSVLRPSTLTDTSLSTENWTITAQESSGLSRGTVSQPYTVPDNAKPLRFDFGVYGSPVQTGFLPVIPQTIYSATRGYGWTSRVAGVDRKDNVNAGTSSNLRRDLNYAKDATFKVDLPDGTYSVQIYHSNPMYYGTVPYVADEIQVIAEPLQGGQVVQPTIASIPAGTTTIQTLTVTVSGGALELQFKDLGGQDGNFVVSGLDISVGSGTWPAAAPLLAAGDPLDDGAAAISVAQLGPVLAEAASRWTATGLTAQQAATLSSVQLAVADLGGAYLGLANPATNQIRIDDDAARMGWSVVSGQSSVVSGQWRGGSSGTTDSGQLTTDGVSLLTVVMHELGHLLGYGHSEHADDLMAPVLSARAVAPSAFLPHPSASSAEAVEPLGQAQWRTGPSAFSLSPASRLDNVFADLGRGGSEERSSVLLESQDGEWSAAATVRPSDEASRGDLRSGVSTGAETRAEQPRSRLQRYERDLDEWFADLASEEGAPE